MGPALGLSSVRCAAPGVFPDWGEVQFHFADEEVRHGEGKGLGWVTPVKGKSYSFISQALDPRPGTGPCEPCLGGLPPGGEGHKLTPALSSEGSRSHP